MHVVLGELEWKKHMYSKKQLPLLILQILREETDSNHPLTFKELKERWLITYDIDADPKTIRSHVRELINFGYDIEGNITERQVFNKKTGNTEIQEVYTDLYIHPEFEESEIRLLIDSILFSQHLDVNQRDELINKLTGLLSQHFTAKVKHIHTVVDPALEASDLFYNIEVLEDAIASRKQVLFQYNQWGIDKQVHPVKSYRSTVNPYQMVAANGRYYLIGNIDAYDNLIHYRLDKITNIEILEDSQVKPLRMIRGYEGGNKLNLVKHLADSLYMFTGPAERVVFETDGSMVGSVLDWFGSSAQFSKIDKDKVRVTVNVNPRSMRYWLLQYLPYVKVIAPESLVERVCEDLQEGLKKYSSNV